MKGRMLSPDMWRDEFFTSLDTFQKLLWIGLITTADDQGRLQDNALVIRSDVLPADNVQPEEIEAALNNYASEGKITRYIANKKHVIQIVNWWKYQSPRWAGKSSYPPPPNWIDRERYHTTGNKIAEKNWSAEGGYIGECIDANTKREGDVEDEVEDDVKGEDEVEDTDDDSPAFQSNPLSIAFEKASKITAYNMPRWIGALDELKKMGATPADVTKTVEDYLSKPVPLKIAGPWSIVNGVAITINGRKAKKPDKTDPSYYKDSAYADQYDN